MSLIVQSHLSLLRAMPEHRGRWPRASAAFCWNDDRNRSRWRRMRWQRPWRWRAGRAGCARSSPPPTTIRRRRCALFWGATCRRCAVAQVGTQPGLCDALSQRSAGGAAAARRAGQRCRTRTAIAAWNIRWCYGAASKTKPAATGRAISRPRHRTWSHNPVADHDGDCINLCRHHSRRYASTAWFKNRRPPVRLLAPRPQHPSHKPIEITELFLAFPVNDQWVINLKP